MSAVLVLVAVCVLVAVLPVVGRRGEARRSQQRELLQVRLQARAAERELRDVARNSFLRMSAEAERRTGGGRG